jgi:mono/diheme cytochrome c family protein
VNHLHPAYDGKRLRRALALLGTVLLAVLLAGCYQGRPKKKPPIHVNPNMDWQPKYEPQESSPFFANGSVNQTPVEGTVSRDRMVVDPALHRGVDPATGEPVEQSPLPVTMTNLQRGQERYDIYCTPCHGLAGDAKGIVVQRGFVPPTDFHQEMVREYTDGHLFQVISEGIRNMKPYGGQIPVEDRWRIVQYVRALQRSQHAAVEDVPEQTRDQLR